MRCPCQHVLKLDGRRIQTESDWLYSMAELFMFPVYTENGNIPWFRGAFENEMLRNEPEVKEYVMNNLKDTVLPWWESEVVNCVVEGKRKSFNVYLVDDNSVITENL